MEVILFQWGLAISCNSDCWWQECVQQHNTV